MVRGGSHNSLDLWVMLQKGIQFIERQMIYKSSEIQFFFFFFGPDRMANDQWLAESTSECWPWEEGTRVIDGLLSSASCPHINCASLPHLQSYIRLSIWHCFLASCSGNKTSSCSGPRQPRWMPVMVVVVGNEACRRTPGREGGGRRTNAFSNSYQFSPRLTLIPTHNQIL